MNSFWQQEFWNNTILDYLITIGVILFVVFLNKIISRYLASLLCRIFKRTWKTFDQQTFVDLIIHPLGTFLVITVTIIMMYRLNYPPALNFNIYKYSFNYVLLTIATLIQIAAFIWLLWRIIDFIANVLSRRIDVAIHKSDNQLIVFFKDFLKVLLGIVGMLMILRFAFNYNIGSLLTGLSIVGAAIALALRESIENLIASFVIFFDKPFFTGDFVRVQNVAGVVERIGLRSTRIRTVDKSYVTVPNKQMVDSILDNVSQRSNIRGEILLHLQVQTTHEQIERLIAAIRDFLSKQDRIQNFNVLFNDIRFQALIVQVEFFTPPIPWPEFTVLRQQLNLYMIHTMENLQIKVAEGRG